MRTRHPLDLCSEVNRSDLLGLVRAMTKAFHAMWIPKTPATQSFPGTSSSMEKRGAVASLPMGFQVIWIHKTLRRVVIDRSSVAIPSFLLDGQASPVSRESRFRGVFYSGLGVNMRRAERLLSTWQSAADNQATMAQRAALARRSGAVTAYVLWPSQH